MDQHPWEICAWKILDARDFPRTNIAFFMTVRHDAKRRSDSTGLMIRCAISNKQLVSNLSERLLLIRTNAVGCRSHWWLTSESPAKSITLNAIQSHFFYSGRVVDIFRSFFAATERPELDSSPWFAHRRQSWNQCGFDTAVRCHSEFPTRNQAFFRNSYEALGIVLFLCSFPPVEMQTENLKIYPKKRQPESNSRPPRYTWYIR